MLVELPSSSAPTVARIIGIATALLFVSFSAGGEVTLTSLSCDGARALAATPSGFGSRTPDCKGLMGALNPTYTIVIDAEKDPQETHAGLNAAPTLGAGVFVTAGGTAVVPGEIIVKYRSSVLEPVEQVLAAKRAIATAVAGGDDSLDRLHERFAVRRVQPVFRPALGASSGRRSISAVARDRRARVERRLAGLGRRTRAFRTGNSLPDLSRVYRLRLGAGVDLEAAVDEFRRNPHVEYAHRNHRAVTQFTPNDPFFASAGSWGQSEDDLWGLYKLDVEQAWDVTLGTGIVVAVVDTGLDSGHPDIAANVWVNPEEVAGNGVDDDGNGYVDDLNGWDFVSDDNDPADGHGHGTHVSGTIAAIADNGLGIVGVAPEVRIMPLKGLSDGGSGASDGLASAIAYAADNGADVVNNSWGCLGRCPSIPVFEDAVRYAHGWGVTVVFAAGNSTDDVAFYSPQNRPEPIVVSATTQDDVATHFTNFGLVDVAAPGGGIQGLPTPPQSFRNILSLKSASCSAAVCPAELIVASDYLRQAGTSMSSPHVAGVAALVLAAHPAYGPEEVRQVIRSSSEDVGDPGFDTFSGYGRVNAWQALNADPPLAVLITGADAAANPSTKEIEVFGLADGPGFDSWSLDYGTGTAPSSWTAIASSTGAMSTPSLLATWDISAVPDGRYTLRLRAWNAGAGVYEDRHSITIDQVRIDAPTSEFTEIFRGGDLISVVGTVAPSNFSSFAIQIRDGAGALLADPAITRTGDGQQEVYDDVLGTWDTTGVAGDHYQIFVTVQLTSGGPLSDSVRVIVDPTLHPGWPVNVGLIGSGIVTYSITDQLDIADIDGDGKAEVAIAYGSTVRVFDDEGQILPGWPQSVDPADLGKLTQKSPVIADVDGDGVAEVIASNNGSQIFVWRPDGTPLAGWPRSVGGSLNSMTAADMDGDGVPEIISADWGGQVKVLKASGAALSGWPKYLPSAGFLLQPAVGDVDGDGTPEVVVAAGLAPSDLYVLHSDGTVMSGWPKAINSASPPNIIYSSYPALGDMDGDGDLEIVIGAWDGTVHAFHHDGTDVSGWPQLALERTNSPTLGDVDGDGQMEVFVGVHRVIDEGTSDTFNYLHAWRADGTELSGWPVVETPATTSYFGFGAAALADIDDDGDVEIIASSDDSGYSLYALKALHHDGSQVAGFPKPTAWIGAYSSNTAALGDVDGDGLLEMAWIDGRANVYVWDLAGSAVANLQWPMFHHDAAHSGVNPNDVDGDGVDDGDDNCLTTPNGPLQGTCSLGKAGELCTAHSQCDVSPGDGLCSLAQDDADGDGLGDVCDPDPGPVPEPGEVVMLLWGLALLYVLQRRRLHQKA